jgi:hypothetical protein
MHLKARCRSARAFTVCEGKARQDPALSRALLTFVIRVMAERLSFASRSIGVLQR